MTLIALYKCDEQDNDATTLADSSGHSNDHSLPSLTLDTGVNAGFEYDGISCRGNTYTGDASNGSDLSVVGACTVMAWVRPTLTAGNPTWVLSFGDDGSTQAENVLWSLEIDVTNNVDKFGMEWQHSAGTGVAAWSPVGSLSIFQPDLIHICCIRTINGSNRDVKFVKNGVDLAADVTGLTAPDGGSSSGCQAFRIPRHTTGYGRLDAHVANMRFYDEALSVAQVLAIYNAEKANKEDFGVQHTGTMLPQPAYSTGGWQAAIDLV